MSTRLSSAAFISIATLSAARLAAQPTTPPPASAAAGNDHIQHLDAFVVSAGHDPKTAFDVAQGTSVLAGEELHRLVQATLGETLSSTPGVSSTYYGPGASRPVIRGLGGDRIRVLDNGIGALDVSNVSPDHNTTIEPLFASRIEVLRGPTTLLYGSSAIGGVVNAIDNAIPETAPDGQAHGAIELRAGGAARERAAVASVGGGAKQFSGQLNLMKQRTSDVRIPGFARIDPDAPATQTKGTLSGSATESMTASLGGTLFWAAGHAGAAISRFENDYGVPTGEDPGTSISMRRSRLDLAGEVTQPFGVFHGAKARFGIADYKHSELSGGTIVNSTFTNKAWEGRAEASHEPIGNVTGTVGVQVSRSSFASSGVEVVLPSSVTQNGALFALEEVKLRRKVTLQLGARYEGQSIKLGTLDPSLPRLPGYTARSGQKKTADGLSGSFGVVFNPAKDWAVAAAIAYTDRLPTAQELFSNGPHGGTAAYEIGTSALGNEKSVGLDLSVRRRAGFATGSIGVFANRFSDYIFQRELPRAAVPIERNPDGLTPFQFVATDARFYGGEAELVLHLIETEKQRIHLELSSDYVRATDRQTNEPLPRIPPLRQAARLNFEDGRWHALLEVRHAQAQRRVAANEAPTPDYTLVNASVSFLIPRQRISYEIFARLRNVTNEEAREHTSFLKEFAPLPGRGLLAGIRATF